MRKLKIVVVFNFIFNLVTPNPLQEYQSSPLTHHQNYVNINPSSVSTHFEDYSPQIQNQQYQLSNIYEEQLKRLYLENILSNVISNTYANPNSMFNRDQIDFSRNAANPSRNIANAFNNHGFGPQGLLNYQIVGNEVNKYMPQINNEHESNLWIPHSNTYNDDTHRIDANILNNRKKSRNSSGKVKSKNKNQDNKQPKNMGDNKLKLSENITTKKGKKHNSKADKSKVLTDNDEVYTERPQPTVLSLSNTKQNSDEYLNSSNGKIGDKRNSKQKFKNKGRSNSKSTLKENVENTEIQKKNSKSKDISLSQIAPTKCLDINEDCTNLENRRTRNNYNTDGMQHQFSGIPKEFTENMRYINNFMPTQNYNVDLFSGQGNFPYNFDYLYQTPHNSNAQSNESDRRIRRRRKKKKQKKQKNIENTTEPPSKDSRLQTKGKQPYDLIIELLPKVSEVNSTTESIPTEITTVKEIETDITIMQKTIDDTTIKNYSVNEGILHPDNEKEHLSNDLSQEYEYPFGYDNRVNDYYPDFKLDKIYLSKEDNDWTFHDRHYYSSDDKPDFRRERRKYESSYRRQVSEKGHQESPGLNEQEQTHVDSPEELKISKDIIFRTPPELEFPDFKTQMVNKDSYSSADDRITSYSNSKSSSKLEKNNNNSVETVYALSKVVKYGAAETNDNNKEKTFAYIKNNIYTSDEDTTVVVAKSVS